MKTHRRTRLFVLANTGRRHRIPARLASALIVGLSLAAAFPAHASCGAHLGWLPLVVGQSSLDLDVEEEEPPLTTPPVTPPATPDTEADAPAADAPSPLDIEEEEEPLGSAPDRPVAPKPSEGTSGLDDLRGLSADDDEQVERGIVCDVLHAYLGQRRGTAVTRNVVLFPHRFVLPAKTGRTYEFTGIGPSGKGNIKIPVFGEMIVGIEYYEQRMLAQAAAELNLDAQELVQPGVRLDLSSPERVKLATRAIFVLQTALREHDSAVQRFLRRGKGWTDTLRGPLVLALFNLQASRVQTLIDQGLDRQAELACERLDSQLGPTGPHVAAIHRLFEQVYIPPARQAMRTGDYELARELLDQYAARYPLQPKTEAAKFQAELIAEARSVMVRAQRETDPRQKLVLLEEAVRIWPRLTGIDELRRVVETGHPILECAYARLPKNLSPLSARTPEERHAVALMFEGLVRWTIDPVIGPHYETQLAMKRPIPLARGRQFFLPRCCWSDAQDAASHMCTVEDVRRTILLLDELHPAGFSPSWSKLIEGLDTSGNRDPFTVAIMLTHDYWQPLALMDFKIVPGHCFPTSLQDEAALQASVDAFNAHPVGTGPYRLLDRDEERVRFVANSRYRKPGLPNIKEIAFKRVDPNDFVGLYERGEIQVAYGVRAEHVAQFERRRTRVTALRTRSACFLAPNVRKLRNKGLEHEELRLAIAHAIDREEILDKLFRPGGHDTDHEVLTGPFPKHAWATNPGVKPFGISSQVDTQLALAKEKLQRDIPSLTLVYPARNPEIEAACKSIQSQLSAVGIPLRLDDCEPGDFREQIVQRQNFDLVYWQHDFEDETYWLWPLFDPDNRDPWGANFMGYGHDKELQDLFVGMKTHKHFPSIRRSTHELHEYIARHALVIPLWQLDTYVVVDPSVKNVTLDPIGLFGNVEHWELSK